MVDGKVKIYSSIWGDKALNEKISKLNWRDYIKDINEDKLQEIREKVNNAKEPNTELMAFGAEGERARNIIKLLEDFHNVANQ